MDLQNTINAFMRGIDNDTIDIINLYTLNSNMFINRIVSVGDVMEMFVKDLYANTLHIQDINEKNLYFKDMFSYVSKQSAPPDLIVRGHEAIEIKKQNSMTYAELPLNSSYPRDYIYADSKMLTAECRNCEDGWDKKPLVYVVGNIDKKNTCLDSVWFAVGNCFCADRQVYEHIKKVIEDTILANDSLSFNETNELGRVSNIDNLNYSSLRIRGMWNLKHPGKIFGDFIHNKVYDDLKTKYRLVILEEDFNNVSSDVKVLLMNKIKDGVIEKVHIQINNPNDRNELLNALIFFN